MNPDHECFYYLGIFAMSMSSLITSLNLLVTMIYRRAPGVTWGRMPVFAWSQVAVAIMSMIWLPEIQTGMVMGLLDRVIPTNFFNPHGGYALAWESLFWLFGHPEVYIVMLPAWGVWLEITSVMSRKTLFAKKYVITALGFLAVLSSMVWAHHMFTSIRNSEMIPFSFFTESVSIPTGVMFLSALGTMWNGRIRFNTPMWYVLASMFNFTIGGLTGFFLADVPANLALHNTFFVVAHFHFTFLGGMIFAWLGALYYWFPKITGKMYNERWGKLGALLVFVFFNATFLQMFLVGLHGMNRWVAQYPAYLANQNLWISVSAFLLGIGFIIAFWNMAISWVKGVTAAENPWDAKTLEWITSSPPPVENFSEIPVVADGFYRYGAADPELPLFEAETLKALARRQKRHKEAAAGKDER
ncbi:cytochrome c oxidase subunit I [Ferroacidibacillus organovorans]|nr:cbb3-type cytochrome c oxidase subunit I [Ferroacidibacillus organovorans]